MTASPIAMPSGAPRCGRPRAAAAAALLALAACAGSGMPGAGGPGSPTATQASPAATSPSPSPAAPRRFAASISPVAGDHRARMGTSWQPGCPVPLADLRVITMTHWDFAGGTRWGELMVHRRYAEDVVGVFRALFAARFPIERMELSNGYLGNDPPLAQRNNTVGFHCRPPVGGGRTWSEHAYGRAVDVNPDQNPYVTRAGRIEPTFGAPWVDRSRRDPGMIHPGGPVVRGFRAIGWLWGGDWTRSKDYMHFSPTGL